MWKYILKRTLFVIPVIIVCTLLVFVIMNAKPGDPGRAYLGVQATQEDVDAYNAMLGLNDPLMVRYLNYMKNLLKGDFGVSYIGGKAIWPQIRDLFPNTLKISALSIVFSVIIAIPLGVISAVKQYSLVDRITSVIAMIFASIPSFWYCLLLLLFFSLKLKLFPTHGLGTWRHYILPMLALSCNTIGSVIRLTRSSMLEEIRKDYVRTARAKGAKEYVVTYGHALRNSLIPVVTSLGNRFTILMGGTVFIESVFGIPGLGRLVLTAINQNDTPLLVGCVVVVSVCSVIINLLVDIVYAFLDPRIKAKYLSASKPARKKTKGVA